MSMQYTQLQLPHRNNKHQVYVLIYKPGNYLVLLQNGLKSVLRLFGNPTELCNPGFTDTD